MDILIMRQVAIATVMLLGVLADVHTCAGQPFPSSGSPNPAMTGDPRHEPARSSGNDRPDAPATAPATRPADAPLPPGSAPRAVTVARATEIPALHPVRGCGGQAGRRHGAKPAQDDRRRGRRRRHGAVICVAEGTYAEQLKPGEKVLHARRRLPARQGFQGARLRRLRDQGDRAGADRSSASRIPAPRATSAPPSTASTSPAIRRRSFATTTSRSASTSPTTTSTTTSAPTTTLAGAGFALNNVSGRIEGNVFRNNACGRGGAGFLNDYDATRTRSRSSATSSTAMPGPSPTPRTAARSISSATTLRITGNLFTRNTVTQWGGGLYVGA